MRFKKYHFIFFGALIFVFFIYSFHEIVIKPFPFVRIHYIYSQEKFNDNPDSSLVNIYIPNISKFKKLLMLKTNYNFRIFNSDIDKIKWAVYFVRKCLYITKGGWSLRHNINEVFDTEHKYLYICSEASKMFVAISQLLGYPARVIWMDGHTTSEIFLDQHWVLVDSYYNLMFKSLDNRYLSLLDSVKLYKLGKAYPVRIIKPKFKNNSDFKLKPQRLKVYKNQSLFVVLSGKDIFYIDRNSRNLMKILKYYITCNSPIAVGMQYIEKNYSKVGNNCLQCYLGFCK